MNTAQIIASPWPDPVVPDISLPEFLLAHALCWADRPAITDASASCTLTYRELADAVRHVAAGLAAHGLKPGQTFAILAPNSAQWLVACLGAMLAGGVVTGVDPAAPPGEIAAQLAGTDARFVLTTPALADQVRAAVRRAGSQVMLITLGPGADDALPFSALSASGCRRPLERLDPAGLALVAYSSGTTGPAKAARLSHRACLANVRQLLTASPAGRTDRVLAVTPFSHVIGLIVLAARAVLGGATLVTLPRFEVNDFLAAVHDHRITQTVVAPPDVEMLATHPAVDRYDLSSLRWIGCWGAPLDADLQRACSERIGCPLGQVYGMTEATAAIAIWRPGAPVIPGSAGRLLPGVGARIVDQETGAYRGRGAAGELLVRTPALMTGYLSPAGKTGGAVDADGWLHTGDIGRFDADGNLFVTGRIGASRIGADRIDTDWIDSDDEHRGQQPPGPDRRPEASQDRGRRVRQRQALPGGRGCHRRPSQRGNDGVAVRARLPDHCQRRLAGGDDRS
jgi:acyl-CoA synthetase (AMP-forming)/AMP-acid ligase II